MTLPCSDIHRQSAAAGRSAAAAVRFHTSCRPAAVTRITARQPASTCSQLSGMHPQAHATPCRCNRETTTQPSKPLLPHLPPIGCSCAVPQATSCSQHRIQGPAAPAPSNRLLQGPAAHQAAPAQQLLLLQHLQQQAREQLLLLLLLLRLQQARDQQLWQGGATAADCCCPVAASRLLLLLVLAAAAAAAARHWRRRRLDTQQVGKDATAATTVGACSTCRVTDPNMPLL